MCLTFSYSQFLIVMSVSATQKKKTNVWNDQFKLCKNSSSEHTRTEQINEIHNKRALKEWKKSIDAEIFRARPLKSNETRTRTHSHTHTSSSEAGMDRQVSQYSFNSWAHRIVFADNWNHSHRTNKVEFYFTDWNDCECNAYSSRVFFSLFLSKSVLKSNQIHTVIRLYTVSHITFGFSKSIWNEVENAENLIWNWYRESRNRSFAQLSFEYIFQVTQQC